MGHYVGLLAARNAQLRDTINQLLREAMRATVRLERIFRKWNVWNDDQPNVSSMPDEYRKSGPTVSGFDESATLATLSRWKRRVATSPRCCEAEVTIVLSCLAMLLAVAVGVVIATGRV